MSHASNMLATNNTASPVGMKSQSKSVSPAPQEATSTAQSSAATTPQMSEKKKKKKKKKVSRGNLVLPNALFP